MTINPDYFRLRRPIERRLYELARKHCGEQTRFVIGVELLQEKCGSQAALKEFRRALRELVKADRLPDYKLELDDDKDQAIFLRRTKLPREVLRSAGTELVISPTMQRSDFPEPG